MGGQGAWVMRPGAFRLLLALTVFVHHCSRWGFGKGPVYLFFALSGYWVQRMWMARYARTRRPYLTYLVSRGWRLLPAFLLASVVAVVIALLLGRSVAAISAGRPARLLVSSLLLLGYADLTDPPVGPAWSLDIEARYYLLAPLLIVVLARGGRRVAGCALAVAGLLSFASAVLGPAQPLLINYLFFFVAGLLAAQADWRVPPWLARLSGGGALGLLAVAAAGPWRSMLLVGARQGPWFAYNAPLNVGVAVVALPYALCTTGRPSDTRDRAMADLSYLVYLLHWPGIECLDAIGGTALHRLPYLPAVWGAVLGGSWLAWRYLDRPINAARARWVARRLSVRAAAVAHEPPGP